MFGTILAFVMANWELFLIGLYVAEKIVKLTPTDKDDIVFDMIVKPVWKKFFAKKTT